MKEESKKGRKGTRMNKEKKKRGKRNPVTQWDEECDKVTNERKKRHKEWIKKPNLKNYIEYKRVNALARKTKESLINFASSLNRKFNIRYVWDRMKTVKNSFNTIDWRRWQNKDRET